MRVPKFAFVFAVLIACVCNTYGQGIWTNSSAPKVADRYDDVYFINPDTGWAIKINGQVLKTTDGGLSWQNIYTTSAFFRDVGFLDAQTGFIGTLQSTGAQIMYKTNDGGFNWSVVNNLPGPDTAGICGMRVINDSTIYGVGRFYGPAGFYKTTDKGITWSYKDMSAYAGGLVDIHFFNKDTGFVVGTNGPFSFAPDNWFDSSAVVLYTTDAGNTWQVKKVSSHAHEGCWKIVFSTRNTGYISIESMRHAAAVDTQYFLKTVDGGQTWNEMPLCVKPGNGTRFEPQGIGFINDNVGWISGRNPLGSVYNFKTTDGGVTWSVDSIGTNINRFRFFSDTMGYAAGASIYKYKSSICQTPRSVAYVGACENESVIYHGYTFDYPGTYKIGLLNAAGCDSVVELHVNYKLVSHTNFEHIICNGDSFLYEGQYYDSLVIFRDTLQNMAGCDSIIETVIYELPRFYTDTTVYICNGQTYYFDGQFISDSKYYYDTLQSTLVACDSFVRLLLVSDSFVPGSLYVNTCLGYGFSYYFNDQILTSPGLYYDTLISAGGCDSILTLYLTKNIDTPVIVFTDNLDTVCINGGLYILRANLSGSGFNGPGVNSVFNESHFDPLVAGLGEHIITYYYYNPDSMPCPVSTSRKIFVVPCTDTTGIYEPEKTYTLKVYPNPANKQLIIEMDGKTPEAVEIYDVYGKMVLLFKNPASGAIDISKLPGGVYLAVAQLNKKFAKARWVKM